ncbi:MAG: ABC transporter substrate-binding protein [Flavobacteriales bacterium]|nr:ABC transporter substrate-binding protein [Flavobacteriales bacterium]
MRFGAILLGIVILFSCLERQQDQLLPGAVIQTIKPQYAKGFEIQVLADSTKRIVLFNLEKEGDTLQIINWNNDAVKDIACLSTTHIAILNKLNSLNKVRAVGFADMVRNPEAMKLIDEGKIINLSSGHDVDDEILYSVNPDLFFIYPFDGSDIGKYESKGIRCVQVSEYLERHPLARAEWIKLFAVFLDAEDKATLVFSEMERRYLEAKEDFTDHDSLRPTVFTGSYENGIWFAPPGNSFVGQLLKDAGAKYIFEDSISTSNISLQFEELFEKAYEVDWWGKVVYEEGELTLEKISESDERYAQLKSFRERQIFYCNASEVDYFGDALMEPDVLLKDLILIFHPESAPGHKAKYFRRIE